LITVLVLVSAAARAAKIKRIEANTNMIAKYVFR
jgi:hypothetical protein